MKTDNERTALQGTQLQPIGSLQVASPLPVMPQTADPDAPC